nr:hypothetical protein Iba_chr14cCG1620 [Ipomoea batatas]
MVSAETLASVVMEKKASKRRNSYLSQAIESRSGIPMVDKVLPLTPHLIRGIPEKESTDPEACGEWGRKTRQSLSLKEGGNIAKTETQVKEINQIDVTEFPLREAVDESLFSKLFPLPLLNLDGGFRWRRECFSYGLGLVSYYTFVKADRRLTKENRFRRASKKTLLEPGTSQAPSTRQQESVME